MRRTFFILAWAFILCAAAYDTYFAWYYREVLLKWEMNGLVRWAGQMFGLEAVFAFKVLGMAFATGMAIYCHRRRHRLEIPLTLIIGCSYLLLSLHYVAGHLASPGF
jgi:hypothetical protein